MIIDRPRRSWANVLAALVLLLATTASAAAQSFNRAPGGGGGRSGGGGLGSGLAIGIGIGAMQAIAAEERRERNVAARKRKPASERSARRSEPVREKSDRRPKGQAGDETPTTDRRRKDKPGRPKGGTDTAGNTPTGNGPKGDSRPDRTPDRPGDTRPRPDGQRPPRGDIACLGGALVRGDCVCPRITVRRAVGTVGFFCGRLIVDRLDPIPPRVHDGGDAVPPLVLLPTPPLPPRGQPPRMLPPSGPSTAPGQPPGVTPATAPAAEFVPDEILIEVAAGDPPDREAVLAQAFQLTLLEQVQLPSLALRLARYRIPDGRDVPAVVASLAADGRVVTPQANFLYRPQAGAAAAKIAESVATLQYGLAKIGAPAAHRLSTGRGVTVAVIDTGVDATHPDLAGAVAELFDATEAGQAAPLTAAPHATAIAGIIAARGLARGIAPDAHIISARAFRAVPGGLEATSLALLRSLEWSIVKGARVVNMSFAGPQEPLLGRAVAAATARDIILVAAAGNGGKAAPPAYPAAYPGVIAVTATDTEDRLYQSANQGQYIALAAPGVDIFAPAPGKAHDVQSGTSMAAAHVSGMIALLLQDRAGLSAQAVRRAVTESAVDLGRPGIDEEFGAGRGNAVDALRLVTQMAQRPGP